ncbi:MAG TPA: hypothetical protein PKC60_04125 [Hydrogenophaga sp.]|uniref:hypothetical protein n=1 Tax=Hydrogenophaga sp. TaxID=1904254 RepID=UPI002D0CDDEB|nr:hypothetical protein [Hydrogenophaga sp.]HMN92398.1 hypothetical protein [Hydrogenophaga sp.]HMP12029.1 hypothetical protein [Hydrogenophaga sp.]
MIKPKATSRQPDARLVVANLLPELDHVCELVRSDPCGLRGSIKTQMIDPLWRYIERAGNTESRDSALALVEVAEDVLRHVAAGRLDRASWLADRLDVAALRFRASFDYMVHTTLPAAQEQRKAAGAVGGRQAKRSPVRQLLVDTLTQLRVADPAIKKHDALIGLMTSPAASLRVTKVPAGWRIEDQDADPDAVEDLNEGQTKDLWKAAGQKARKKTGK